ncbi:hypothetical protein Ae406Ps2_3575c [Pseudonocardia sp. Ae406_Ps2]|nr:hypothetical protein Ae406Ps2_3575c [Pseudonocardia sp. Ae406_Ps2]OLM25136.1 hypothetical protein Ae706Ps2_3569c [Pseudonocardia sp. Ae706_Ps2]
MTTFRCPCPSSAWNKTRCRREGRGLTRDQLDDWLAHVVVLDSDETVSRSGSGSTLPRGSADAHARRRLVDRRHLHRERRPARDAEHQRLRRRRRTRRSRPAAVLTALSTSGPAGIFSRRGLVPARPAAVSARREEFTSSTALSPGHRAVPGLAESGACRPSCRCFVARSPHAHLHPCRRRARGT